MIASYNITLILRFYILLSYFMFKILIILGSFIGESTTCVDDFSTLLRFLTIFTLLVKSFLRKYNIFLKEHYILDIYILYFSLNSNDKYNLFI